MLALGRAIAALMLLCVAAPAMATPDAVAFRRQVDLLLEKQLREQHVPGAAVAVLHKGEVVLARGYGLANVELDTPVTTQTIFQSGSLGKMFTAAAVMTQVEQGRIGLDDPVRKYLPDAPASWAPITVRNLLTHTSGIPNYGPDFDYRRDYTDDDLLKLAYALPLGFRPGVRFSYSNTGYEVLGILVRKAVGRPYSDILAADIFKPLGMKTARLISEADIVPHRASGYRLVDGQLKNQEWVSPTLNTTADGALYFSLDDMIAWAQGVERGAALSSASWRQTYTPVRLNSGKTYPYGFGWQLDTAGGQPRYHHAGAWQGFRTSYSRYLGDDLSIVLLTNSDATDLDLIVDSVAGLWDPALVAHAPRPKPEPDIERRVTALIEAARTGALRQQDMPLAEPTSAAALNDYLPALLKPLGALTRLELTERRELGDDTVYSYVATFGDRTLKVRFGMADGQVSAFRVTP